MQQGLLSAMFRDSQSQLSTFQLAHSGENTFLMFLLDFILVGFSPEYWHFCLSDCFFRSFSVGAITYLQASLCVRKMNSAPRCKFLNFLMMSQWKF